MPKATPIRTTSVDCGHGGPVLGPVFPAMPVTTMPSTVDERDQKDRGQELKAGAKPPTQRNWNPGK